MSSASTASETACNTKSDGFVSAERKRLGVKSEGVWSVSVGSPPTLLFLAESILALARSIFAGNNCDARQINHAPPICMGAVPGRGNCICYFWSERAHADDGSPQICAAHHAGGVRHFSTIRIFARDWNRGAQLFVWKHFQPSRQFAPSFSVIVIVAREITSAAPERESLTHAREMCLP